MGDGGGGGGISRMGWETRRGASRMEEGRDKGVIARMGNGSDKGAIARMEDGEVHLARGDLILSHRSQSVFFCVSDAISGQLFCQVHKLK